MTGSLTAGHFRNSQGFRRVLTQDLRSCLGICRQDLVCRSGVLIWMTDWLITLGTAVIGRYGRCLAVVAESVVLWVQE